jgi:hypothetical protein
MRAAIALGIGAALISLTGCPQGSASASPPPAPAPAPAASAPSYGAVMADVARRFELIGRAGAARRFEFADFELGEIEETFETTLPIAERPKEGHPEVLPDLQAGFLKQVVPELRQGIASKDAAAFAAAFGRAAGFCNSCHQASGHGFIEIPSQPGHAVPDLDPLPAPTGSR